MKNKLSLLIAALGLWLLAAPITFGYKASAMTCSDHISGALLIFIGLFCYKMGTRFWAIASLSMGFWLQLAPLFFWAPEPASYINDTAVGILVLILSFALPAISGQDRGEGNEYPQGWSFNPSEMGPRVVTTGLAMVCWFLARYLAAYQLGYITYVEDPFFGDGSMKVISSTVAGQFPISDAGLGAVVYSLEFVLGWVGGRRRWCTMPWLAGIFGLMVVPAGITSILLIVSQPVLVGAWCGICLLIAACMLIMVLLTLPEMTAVLQLLYKAKKRGMFWRTFWKGAPEAAVLDPVPVASNRGFSRFGFTCPWNLVALIGVGAWLMCAPTTLGIAHPAADSNYVVGPLLIAFSLISMAETARFLRFANMFLALFLFVSLYLFSGFSSLGAINTAVMGVLIALLSYRKGKIIQKYGVN